MKGKAVIPLVLGLCVGLLAVKFGLDAIRSAEAKGSSKKTVKAVVAVDDIEATMEINKEMVKEVDTIPNSLIPDAERVSSMDEVVGRVAAKTIPQGAALLRSMLAEEGTPPGMLGLIEPGYRAFSVKIDEVTGVAYQIRPGDWVDVLVVMDIKGGGNQKETIAEVILQKVKVAAVGRSDAAGPDGKPSRRPAKSATLLVPDEEVPKLHLAATRGRISLALRGDDDSLSRPYGMARMSETFESLRQQHHQDEELDRQRREAEEARRKLEEMKARIALRGFPSAQVDTEPSSEPEPHAVTFYYGGRKPGDTRIERVTFLNDDSRTILDLSHGPVGKASSMMKSGEKESRRAGSSTSERESPRPRRAEVENVDSTEPEVEAEENNAEADYVDEPYQEPIGG
jgi:pilus assembly protein CpaB